MEHSIRSYTDIDDILKSKPEEVCIFGAGKLGKGDAYEFLKSIGVKIDFYCDNGINTKKSIKDGIKSRPVSYLYENKGKIYVFVCMADKYWDEIREQFRENGIEGYSFINWNAMAAVLETVDKAGEIVKKRYHKFYDNAEFLKYEYVKFHGEEPDLDNPKNFNEKLQWLKLHNYHPEYTRFVDKLAFKQYIEENFGAQHVIPLLGAWDDYDDIDFDGLPDKFVLKCTHDSGSIVIVEDKEKIDHKKARERLNSVLGINYYWMGREFPYRDAQRKIIAEKYVSDESGELKDYKLFCFNGKVKLIQVDFDRFIDHKRNLYDLSWNYVPLSIQYPTSPEVIIDKPQCLNDMIRMAEKLSENIAHVRVDFYIIKGVPIVGEMTFFHGGGMEKFTPESWNYKLGGYIELPERSSVKGK